MISRRAVFLSLLALPSAGAMATLGRAGEIYTGLLSRTALAGHDPVAYFTQGRPVPGSSAVTATWKGATWRFATPENRTRFLADPERYAPQYGGHCAWAVSQGYTAKGDPNHWKVVDGKLYLNYDASVQATWEKDIPGHIANANTNWPKVKPN